MKKYDILNNFIEIDDETTREYYKISSEWGCECLHCRNFLALARERKLPQEILDILDSLAIPPEKAPYVCEVMPKEEGHLYQVS